jgi:hypothetical protein
MRSVLLTASVIVLCMIPAGRARSDVGLFPGGDRTPRIQVRVENLAEYPSYDFYLKYGLGRGNPYTSPHLTKLVPDAAVYLEGNGRRLTQVCLVAVPHGQPPPSPPPVNDREARDTWVRGRVPGVLQSSPLQADSSGGGLSTSSDGYLLSYRVDMKGDQLNVSLVSSEIVLDDWVDAHPFTVGAGVLISALAVLVAIGWWVLRRRSRLNRLESQTPP